MIINLSFKNIHLFVVLSGLLIASCASGREKGVLIFPDDPVLALELITRELADGNGGVIWDAMPASYQRDINSVAHLLAEKVDAELYNKSFYLIGRIIDVATKQKKFIFNTNFGGKISEDNLVKVEAAWSSIIALSKCLSRSSIGDADGLKSFDGQSFFDSTVSSLIRYTTDITLSSGGKKPFEYSSIDLLESNNKRTILGLTSTSGTVQRMEFTNLQGRWIPTNISNEWVKTMAEFKEKLEAINPEELAKNKPRLIALISMLEGVLKQIDMAETQVQFDLSLQRAVLPLVGLLFTPSGMEN